MKKQFDWKFLAIVLAIILVLISANWVFNMVDSRGRELTACHLINAHSAGQIEQLQSQLSTCLNAE